MNRDEKILFYLNELEKIIIMSDKNDWNNKIISEQVELLKLKNDEYSKLISDMTSIIIELKSKNKSLEEENLILKNKQSNNILPNIYSFYDPNNEEWLI